MSKFVSDDNIASTTYYTDKQTNRQTDWQKHSTNPISVDLLLCNYFRNHT